LTAGGGGQPVAAAGAGPDRLLRVIACFKFGKAVLATLAALGALRLLQPSTAAWADRWLAALALRHNRRLFQRLLAVAIGIPPRGLQALAVGALVLAVLFTVEGVGLWLGKRWGQYLTVVATSLFVPLEVVRLAHRVTPTGLSALLLNLAVVALLVHHLVRHRAGPTGMTVD